MKAKTIVLTGEVAHAPVRAVSRLVSTLVNSVPGMGVAMSGDAARMSACATSSLTWAALVWLWAPTALLAQGPAKITLDDAIQLASVHNHNLLAARTTIAQNQALEVQANVRPNPTLFTDWEYLPLPGVHPDAGLAGYLHDSTEGDLGLSYLFERGQKRQHRLQAARDVTAVSRSTVTDNERTLGFNVGQLFYNVQLAESTLDLAKANLNAFQATVDISESQYRVGSMSQNDYLQIKLQLATFQTNVENAALGRDQALSDLRQLLGYESVPAEYDVAGAFEYQPLAVKLEELQAKALANRPDLRAAQLGVTAAKSQYGLAKANGKQDVTVSSNYSHVNGLSSVTFSVAVPLPIFDRNQGNIAQTRIAINQAKETQTATNGQVLTDVRDAYVGVESNGRVVQIYRTGVLDQAKQSRDISEYSYRHGATALLDFLVAQRNYDAIELAYRQALAAYLTSVEQLRQAVGTRSLSLTKDEICAKIREVGIIPAVRLYSAEAAVFAAEAVSSGGVPIVEVTMTVPGAVKAIYELTRQNPDIIVGAGTVLDVDTAHRCLDAGASFITSTGLDLEIVNFALKRSVVVFPGACTPTEAVLAWRAGSDFVKIFPCSAMGGAGYIRALKGPFPKMPMIASGGVNQQTASDFILAGADALGIGRDLIHQDAIKRRDAGWIKELARRYVRMVSQARSELNHVT